MNAFFYLILLFYSTLALLLGFSLYGDSQIEQIQSGMFFGLSFGCTLIIIIEAAL